MANCTEMVQPQHEETLNEEEKVMKNQPLLQERLHNAIARKKSLIAFLYLIFTLATDALFYKYALIPL
jgi:hypothetical protein